MGEDGDGDERALADEGVRGPERQDAREEHGVSDELGLAASYEVLALAARLAQADPAWGLDLDRRGGDVGRVRVGSTGCGATEMFESSGVDEGVGVEDGSARARVGVVLESACDVEGLSGVEL